MTNNNLNIKNLFDLNEKIAVVTGGASGLGLTISKTLVENGCKTLYIFSRKEDQLKKTKELLLNINSKANVNYLPIDLSNKSGCDKVVDFIKERESNIDILVNNSGVTWGANFNDFPEFEGWDRVLALNVKAIFYLSAGLSDLLSVNKSSTNQSHIINISSVAGLATDAQNGGLTSNELNGTWSYTTSKAALNSLTKTLAKTLSQRFITVNAILPGVFPTRMTQFGISKYHDVLISKQPTGRFGIESDLAGTIVFLTSNASNHVTGNLITLDGASTL